MKYGHVVWYSTFFVLCGFLLLGCAGEHTGDDETQPPGGTNPSIEELGLRLLPASVNLTGLAPDMQARVIRGSYLVNGIAGCPDCHNAPTGAYLAGGQELPLPFADVQGFTTVVPRNLTPDAETGIRRTEEEFITIMRTGIDLTDSTADNPQRLLIMPWPTYRFMSLDDLKAIFAFLQHIPAVRNAVRQTFTPPFPLPPVPFPPLGDGDPINDPDNAELGLRIPQFFSSATADPHAEMFLSQFTATIAPLTPETRTQVGRGSYLVNAIASCNSCHTDGDGDGTFDDGLLPGRVDVNTATYLAGGVDIGVFFGARFFSRNLTPDPLTGLDLSEEQFLQTIQFGADFRRSGHSLRTIPHFPATLHFTLDDLRAVYAYLQAIPPVAHEVEIVP
jgi:hypothetical protein